MRTEAELNEHAEKIRREAKEGRDVSRSCVECERLAKENERFSETLETELEAICREAEAIEDRYNSDDYDGDLDTDELLAETLYAVCGRIRRAIAASARPDNACEEA